MTIGKAIFGAAAAGGVILAVAGPMAAKAEEKGPYVTVEHPKAVTRLGGQQLRTVDCSTLEQLEGKLWLTCEFGRQVDSNNQQICTMTDNMSGAESSAEKKNKLSQALYLTLTHFGRVHGDCVRQAGSVDARLGKNSDLLYGRDWQSKGSCTLIAARDMCRAQMDVK